MAKKSIIARNKRREKLAKSNYQKRESLRKIIKSATASAEEKYAAQLKLQRMRRNTSAVRVRNRCHMTGRPRGVYRIVGLCRNMFRILFNDGVLPGMVRSSW